MFLAIDAGNTKITLGFFDKDVVKAVRSFKSSRAMSYDELKLTIENLSVEYCIEQCMIASVVDELTEKIQMAVTDIYGITPLNFTSEINYGIKIKFPQPEKCGADRIANVYAASQICSQRPIIVVDSGSATTFDIIDRSSNFIGGLIMPGMDMQLNALGEKTSKLPILDLKDVADEINVICDNTKESIYAGVVVAHAQAIQGLIKLCEQKLGEQAYIIGTGGNIKLVNKYLNERKFDLINQHLTLQGIKMIYELN